MLNFSCDPYSKDKEGDYVLTNKSNDEDFRMEGGNVNSESNDVSG